MCWAANSRLFIHDSHQGFAKRVRSHAAAHLLPLTNSLLPYPAQVMSERIRLTIAQQKELLAEYDLHRRNGQRCDQRSVGEWAGRYFKLNRPDPQSTVSRIVKMRSMLEASPSTNSKSLRKPLSSRFDEALAVWISDCASRNIPLSDNIIKQKAERLWGLITNDDTAPELHFSNGWLQKFKKRHGLRRVSYHGEQASAAFSEAERALPLIRTMLDGYNLDEIYNADEFGLQYRLALNKTIAATQLSGSKKDKARITCLACCNAIGSDLVPLQIIGNARSPRAFRGKSGEELGFDYRNNAKAWMTKALFSSGSNYSIPG